MGTAARALRSTRKAAPTAGALPRLVPVNRIQTSQRLGGPLPTSVVAQNAARFVRAAAANGHGIEALRSAIVSRPNDPEYARELVAHSKAELLSRLHEKAATEPARAANELRELVEVAPDVATRAQILDEAQPVIAELGLQLAAAATAKDAIKSTLVSLQRACALAGAEGTRAVADALAPGLSHATDLSVHKELLRENPAEALPFAKAVAQAIGAATPA